MKHLILSIIVIFFESCKCNQEKHVSNSKIFQKSTIRENENVNSNNFSFENKMNWFIQDADLYRNIDSVSEDFNMFYDRFISDSIYQISHVKFPVYGEYEEFDGKTTVATRNNWVFIYYDFRSDFYCELDSNFFFQNDIKFYYVSYRKEVGLMAVLGFEKINNEWYLVLFRFNPY